MGDRTQTEHRQRDAGHPPPPLTYSNSFLMQQIRPSFVSLRLVSLCCALLQTVSYEEKNWYCKTMYIAGKNYDHIEGTNKNLTSPFMFSTNFSCFETIEKCFSLIMIIL